MLDAAPSHPAPHRLTGITCLVLVVTIWSMVPVVLKHLAGIIDPWTVMGIRYLLAWAVWFPGMLIYMRRHPEARRFFRRGIVPALLFFLGQILWSIAPYYNQASVMMYVSRSAFVFSMLMGFWLLKSERGLLRRPGFWLSAGLSLCGLVLMFLASGKDSGTSTLGMLIMLGTALLWGSYGVSLKKFMPDCPARVGFGIVSLYAAPGFLIILLTAGTPTALLTLSATHWILLLFSALISIALGQVLSYTAIQHVGPVLTEGVYNIIPFCTSALAFCFLGEVMNRGQWIGGLFILAGTLLLGLLALRK